MALPAAEDAHFVESRDCLHNGPMVLETFTNHLGNRIHVDPRDVRGARLRESGGDLNPGSLRLWNHALALRDWSLVIDVGCNYGEMLVSAAIPRGADIVAFEPNRSILPYLKKTLTDWGRPVVLREIAVGDAARAAQSFWVDHEWSGVSRLVISAEQGSDASRYELTSVPVSTLDAELTGPGHSCFCMKVDVEGHEQDVLYGARQLLASTPTWAVMIEILHMPEEQISRLAEEYPLYLFDIRSETLVRHPGGDVELTRRMLESGWLYPQDALLLSSPAVLDDQIEREPARETIEALYVILSDRESAAQRAHDEFTQALALRETQLASIRASRSWRMTEPFRHLATVGRSFIRAVRR